MKTIGVKKMLALIFLFSILYPAQSQTIFELTKIAISSNSRINMLKNEYYSASERPNQVSELPDPELAIGGFPLPVETRLGGQQIRMSATQIFPWFGTIKQMVAIENTKAIATYEKINIAILDVRYKVESNALKLWQIDQNRMIIRRSLNILQSLENLSKSKVENGEATTADILRVQLKIEEMNQELIILENERLKFQVVINQLLNRSIYTNIDIKDSISMAIIPYNKDTLLNNIKNNHPLLRMYELQQDVSDQKILLNKLQGMPSYGLGLDYILVDQREDANPSNNGKDILQIKASIKIPLYRKKYAAKEREEVYNINALDHRKQEQLTMFKASIERAFLDYKNALLRKELFEKQIKITKGAIRILNTNYSTKGQNFDELLRLEKELIEYDLKILNAIVKSQLAKAAIDKLINKV